MSAPSVFVGSVSKGAIPVGVLNVDASSISVPSALNQVLVEGSLKPTTPVGLVKLST